jgi:hypothetical protein
MRAIFVSVIAWAMFGAVASAQGVNQTAAANSADTQSIHIGGQCMDVRNGLPPVGRYTRAPVIRWQCTGRDNQNVHLENGALLIGAERAFHVRPMYIPARGCFDNGNTSQGMRHVFHVCAGRGAFSVDRSQPGVVTYNVFGRAGALVLTRGIPLMAERLTAGRTAFNRFTLSGDKLMVTGTNLCVTPPSADASAGSPLYLDLCDAPDQVDSAITGDGAERAHAAFTTP